MDASSRPQRQHPHPPAVLLITDSRRLVPGAGVAARIEALTRQAARAFAAGVDAVQIRESDLDGGALYALTRAIAALGRTIVTGRADVAVAAGAAGVHLKADGPDPARVRAMLPAHLTLSRAVHTKDESARYGAPASLDWLLAGTAFATGSKPGRAPLGIEGVRALAAASNVPVVAVGGITLDTAPLARSAGAAGIAGIGLFLGPLTADHVDRLREPSLE